MPSSNGPLVSRHSRVPFANRSKARILPANQPLVKPDLPLDGIGDGSNGLPACDPGQGIEKRDRFLTPAETALLGGVLRKLDVAMPSAVAAFRLLLMTGCRMAEIRDLRWEYVKGDCVELPDAKTGGRVVPLGPEARAVLASIPREDGNPWVIAGRLPGSHLTDLQRPWRRIRKRAGLEDVRIHDLRHSFASRALALGESPDDDRKAPRAYPGADDGPVRALGARLHPDRRIPHHT